jgi:hypothetical protein
VLKKNLVSLCEAGFFCACCKGEGVEELSE